MNKFLLSVLALMTLFVTACESQSVQAEPAKADIRANASYQAMLGKSLNDMDVADFIASNNCTPSGPFLLCKPAGLALWSDRDQMIKTAYLYISNAEGFTDYEGELPGEETT